MQLTDTPVLDAELDHQQPDFDHAARLQALIQCRDYSYRELEDLNKRILTFPFSEPEYLPEF